MEPTGKFMQPRAVTGKEGAGLPRASVTALQSVEFNAKFSAEPGKFLGLLRAETVRAERIHQEPPRPPQAAHQAAQARADRPEKPSETAGERPEKSCAAAHCGKESPPERQGLPPAADSEAGPAGSSVGADASGAGEAQTGADAESTNGHPSAEPETVAADDATGTEAEPVATGDAVEAEVTAAATAQLEPDVDPAAGDQVPDLTALDNAAGGEPAAATSVAQETGANDAPGAEQLAGPATATMVAEAADADVAQVSEDAEVTVAAGAGSGRPSQPNAQAAERVAENLARNPEAASAGLQRAQEAIARQAPAAPVADETTAPRQPGPVNTTTEARSAQAVSLDLRATEPTTKAAEPAATPRTAELAAPPAPRAPLTGDMAVQIRMPTVAADQVEKALAARNQAAEAIDGRTAVRPGAAATATAAATAGSASAASAAETARASLQHARASFNRPGWDAAMAQRVAQLAARGVQSAQIEVDPPELGPVRVVIQVTNDQQTSVSFSSPNAGVREALELTAQRLREALAESGLDLADVDVSDHSAEDRAAQRDGEGEGSSRSRGAFQAQSGVNDEAVVSVTVRDSDALVDQYV